MLKRSKTAKFKDIKFLEIRGEPEVGPALKAKLLWKHRVCWPEEKPLGRMEPSHNVSKETLPRFFRNFETQRAFPEETSFFFLISGSFLQKLNLPAWKLSCFPRNGGRPRNLCALWERSSQRSWPPGQRSWLNKMLLIALVRENGEKDQKPHLNLCFLC